MCGGTERGSLAAVVFSAKETVYKVWHPMSAHWLGFDDARVGSTRRPASSPRTSPPSSGRRAGHPRVPTVSTGRFVVEGGLVRTALSCQPTEARPAEALPAR